MGLVPECLKTVLFDAVAAYEDKPKHEFVMDWCAQVPNRSHPQTESLQPLNPKRQTLNTKPKRPESPQPKP
eukprot:3055678-Rhodomonas_salina.7